jgi:tetratricopeptide (TPR) repeat protein
MIPRVVALWAAVVCGRAALAAEPAVYELAGQTVPPFGARVTLFGTASPFSATSFVDVTGRFHFKKLQPGLYTLAIFSRRRGEARRTVEIGPAAADRKHRVSLRLELRDSDFVFAATANRHMVSARQLAIPSAAVRDFQEAQRDLGRHNPDAAVKRLERAVERAPQFSAAWNSLGVIAYQTREYTRAEECFQKAVEADPQAYEPLVNLGGVELNLHRLDEAMDYNLKAVLQRPNDALANAQLGLTYFTLGRYDLASKYLERTREIDPANMTYPQLLLFRIHLRRGEREAAASDLEDFLTRHPDWPEAVKVRETIAGLRAAPAR